MRAVRGRNGASRARNPGVVYGAALDKLQKAERELRRAFHRWEKCRVTLSRCERRLDLAMQIESEAARR